MTVLLQLWIRRYPTQPAMNSLTGSEVQWKHLHLNPRMTVSESSTKAWFQNVGEESVQT
jgi:hypothetical protein